MARTTRTTKPTAQPAPAPKPRAAKATAKKAPAKKAGITAQARAITGPQPPSTFTPALRAVMNLGVDKKGKAFYAVKADWLKADTSHLSPSRWDRHETLHPLP
jgi:hypothetical protein